MKKVFLILTIASIILAFSGVNYAENDISILVDGKAINMDVEPYLENGRTMVPLRFVSENLGCKVEWRAKDQTIILREDNGKLYYKIAYLQIGRVDVYSSTPFKLDVPPILKDGRTMIPLRAIAELFDKKVEWDAATRTVLISELDVKPTPTPTPIYTDPPVEVFKDNGYTVTGIKYEDNERGRGYNLKDTMNYFHINNPNPFRVESTATVNNKYDGTLEMQARQMTDVFFSKYEFDYNGVINYIMTHNKNNYKLHKEFPIKNSDNILIISSENSVNIGFVIK